MKFLLRFSAIICLWVGVAIVANTWVNWTKEVFDLSIFWAWQYWLTILLFIIAQALFERAGQLERRE